MTINIKTLQCGECGSSVLSRSGTKQYICAHCSCVSLVEDSVSQRLEKLIGVNTAPEQLSASQDIYSEKWTAR